MKKDWEIKKLYEVCEIECGTRVVRKVDGGTIYPVYGGGGATFKMDTYNRENCLIVSRFAMSEKCTRFVEGKFFLNDSGLSLRANENVIYQKYLETVILGKNDEIYSLGRGAAQKNLDMARFRELEISYPKSLEEQKRIVKILDEKFAQLEKIKTNAQTNLQNAKDLFLSQLTKAFSNTTWEKKKMGDIFEMVRGPFGGSLKKECFKPEGYPVYEQQNAIYSKFTFRYFIDESKYKEMVRFTVKPGDFIMSCSGTMGKVSIVPESAPIGIINQALLKMTPIKNFDSLYIKYYMDTPSFMESLLKDAQGAAIQNVASVKMLKEIEIPLPPLHEQKRIVKGLDTLSEKVRQLQEIYTKQIANCDELKQAYLQKAFEASL